MVPDRPGGGGGGFFRSAGGASDVGSGDTTEVEVDFAGAAGIGETTDVDVDFVAPLAVPGAGVARDAPGATGVGAAGSGSGAWPSRVWIVTGRSACAARTPITRPTTRPAASTLSMPSMARVLSFDRPSRSTT